MPPIVTSADIDRPAAEVFAYATDPAQFPDNARRRLDDRRRGIMRSAAA